MDVEKAFDNVDRKRLFKVMKHIGIEWRDGHIIFQSYKQQKAQIEIKGVRNAP